MSDYYEKGKLKTPTPEPWQYSTSIISQLIDNYERLTITETFEQLVDKSYNSISDKKPIDVTTTTEKLEYISRRIMHLPPDNVEELTRSAEDILKQNKNQDSNILFHE